MDISLKGEKDGLCNRKDCLCPGADHWNYSTQKWYCYICAKKINLANPEFAFENGHQLCVPGWDIKPKQS